LLGRPGSGKTSLTISLITQKIPKIYRKTHHHILILMPENSISSLKNNPFKVLPKENIYNELNEETMMDIYNRVDGYSKQDEKTLLFIDDMTADLKKSKYIIDIFKKLVYNRRHLKLNIIITAQSYVNLPLDIRKNIQNLIMFKPPKKELELVFHELFETKKNLFLDERYVRFLSVFVQLRIALNNVTRATEIQSAECSAARSLVHDAPGARPSRRSEPPVTRTRRNTTTSSSRPASAG
jgi:hypothetical protein